MIALFINVLSAIVIGASGLSFLKNGGFINKTSKAELLGLVKAFPERIFTLVLLSTPDKFLETNLKVDNCAKNGSISTPEICLSN